MLAGRIADRTAAVGSVQHVSEPALLLAAKRRGGAAHAGVVHAPGRAQPARVPRSCAAADRSSRRSSSPISPPRSRSSRCVVTASTPPCSTPTSSCRFTPSASASTSRLALVRSLPSRSAPAPTCAGSAHCSRTTSRTSPRPSPESSPTLGSDDAGAGVRRRPVHRRQLPRRGSPEPNLRAHQGADAHRRDRVARADGRPGGDGGGVRRRPARRRSAAPSSCSTRGPARFPPPTTTASCSRIPGACSPSWRSAIRTLPGSTSASVATTSSSRWRPTGPRVIGLDWRTSIAAARKRLGDGVAFQGNLDPALVLAGGDVALAGAAAVLADNAGEPGHIFNLGHGVHPDSDPGVLGGDRRPRPRGDRVLTVSRDASGVVVMAYGTPRRREDIAAYYTDIRRGRPPSDEQLADLIRRYDAIGGLSPLIERTDAQRATLAKQLDNEAPGEFTVEVGLRHAEPSIEAAVESLADAGVGRIVGLVLAPHYSTMSVAVYLRRAAAAAATRGHPVRRDRELGDGAGVRRLARRRPRDIAGPDAGDARTCCSRPTRCPAGSSTPPTRYPTEVAATAAAVAERSRTRRRPLVDRVAIGRTDRRAVARARPPRHDRLARRIAARSRRCWSARAGSSPIISRCSTTSTSRPVGGPKQPGWRSAARRVVNDDSSVMAALARRIVAAVESIVTRRVVVVGGGIAGLTVAERLALDAPSRRRGRGARAHRPTRRQAAHVTVRRARRSRRRRRRLSGPGPARHCAGATRRHRRRPDVAGGVERLRVASRPPPHPGRAAPRRAGRRRRRWRRAVCSASRGSCGPQPNRSCRGRVALATRSAR